MKKHFLFSFIWFCFFSVSNAETDEPINLSTHYINEIGSVISGGKQLGLMVMGRGSLVWDLKTEKIGLWENGNLRIMGNVTHGGNFSEEKIGDYQVSSNIDAGDHIYIHELYYQQKFLDFAIKFGVQDLNVDFLVSEPASYFLNSSFGVPSVIAHGIPAPIYPLTAMGFVVSYEINNKWSIKSSIYDGLPISFENNPYNTNWHLNDKHGFQYFSELAYKTQLLEQKNTALKIGFYYHTGITDQNNQYYEAYSKKNGYYLIIDQDLWEYNNSMLSIFSQVAYSPSSKQTDNNLYIGTGGIITNPIKLFNREVMGIAAAYAKFNTGAYNYELCFEAFYKFQVCRVMSLQFDSQYIINPGGNLERKIHNALIGFLRFVLEY